MARYRVQGPDGAIHVFEGPEGASQDDILSFAQQHFGSAAPTAPEKPGALVNTAAGVATGVADVGNTLMNLGTRLAPTIEDPGLDFLTKGIPKRADLERMNAARQESQQDFNREHAGTAFDIGRVAGNIGVTLPVGGALGGAIKATSAVPIVQALGNAAASGGMRTGSALPAVQNLAARTAGGAISGGASTALIEPEKAGMGALFGGAIPGVTSVAGRITGAAAGTLNGLVEPLYARGREAIAGRVLTKAAGGAAPDVAARLAAAGEMVPGSFPTAGQVAENGGIAALERALSTKSPHTAEFAARGMEQSAARTQALRNIAQDAPAREAAVAARKAVSDPLYAQATQANYTVDQRLERLLQAPAMAQAMERAKVLAANNQRTFTFDVPNYDVLSGLGNRASSASRQITGQGLLDLKMAIDDMLKDPTTGFQGASSDAVRGLRGKLVNWMEGANPAYREARTTYAGMSKPINAMDIGGDLLDKMRPALADYGNVSRETANAYAKALRDGDKVARKATDFKGAKLEEVMSPEQMQTLGSIASDLARKTNMQELGRGVGSDSFQKFAVGNIADASGFPGAAGAVLRFPLVNKAAGIAYSQPEKQIESLLARALLDPKIASNLMTNGSTAATPPATAIGRMLGRREMPRLSPDQTRMISDLFARATPVAFSR